MSPLALALLVTSIPVYIDDRAVVPTADLYVAKTKAKEIFEAAAIEIEWRRGELMQRNLEEQPPIVLHIVPNAPPAIHPHALAFAEAFGGVHITVLFERVKASMPESPSMALAYVMVHEMTHILEGLERHSESGIMKAHWGWADHYAIRWGRASLDREDVQLIQVGLEARAARLAPPCSMSLMKNAISRISATQNQRP